MYEACKILGSASYYGNASLLVSEETHKDARLQKAASLHAMYHRAAHQDTLQSKIEDFKRSGHQDSIATTSHKCSKIAVKP